MPPSPHPVPRVSRALVLAALALAGCDLGPAFTRPDAPVPPAFRADAAPPAWPDAAWWRGFGSPELDSLIAAAQAYNQDLAAARARIRQADAAVRIAGAALLPSVSGSGAANWRQTSTLANGQQVQRDVRAYSLGLDIGWEVDFWGRNRAGAEAARADAIAARYDEQATAISVVTAVAQSWFLALAINDRLAVARRNIADSEQTLRVVRGRFEAGTANALDVAQQEALLAGQRARLPDLANQVEQQLIALGILTGRAPAEIALRPGSLTRLRRPDVAPGLPSELLARRPDIAAAEARLVAANADLRAARAAFFPTVRLTGSAGLQSAAFSALFAPGALVASLAAGVAQPIFDGGRLRGGLQLASAREAELLARYRAAVLQALTDVDTALTALRASRAQERLQGEAVARARRAAEIARAQLAAGAVDLTAVLQAQTTLYAAQDALAVVRQAQILSLLALFKALGGGWTLPDAPPAVGPADPVSGGIALPVGGNLR